MKQFQIDDWNFNIYIFFSIPLWFLVIQMIKPDKIYFQPYDVFLLNSFHP